jgi:hypothetical protein
MFWIHSKKVLEETNRFYFFLFPLLSLFFSSREKTNFENAVMDPTFSHQDSLTVQALKFDVKFGM